MFRTIAKDFHFLSASAILFVALSFGVLWALVDYASLWQESQATREHLLADSKFKLQQKVEEAVAITKFYQDQAEDHLKQDIRLRANEACEIATKLVAKFQDKFDRDVIQTMVRESLRPIRYNNGRGYFFAVNMDGTQELFADKPEFEGKNFNEIQDSNGQYVVRDMLALAKDAGEGFYKYTWSKPGSERRDHLKIAFVKYVPELDWIIGTGEYMADVEQDLQQEIIRSLEAIHRGPEGQQNLFVVTWDGLVLTGPGQGKVMLEIQDANGLYVVKELIRRAKAGGGFVEYVMPKFKGHRPDPKLSYVAGIPEWRWYIGTGEYIDNIEAAIAEMGEAYRQNLKIHLAYILGITLAVLCLNLLFANLFTGKLKQQTARFVDFFRQAADSPVTIDESLLSHQEFRAIGVAANTMLADRNRALLLAHSASEQWIKTFDAIKDAILLFDDACVCIQANQAAKDLFVEEGPELVGRSSEDFLTQQHPLVQTCKYQDMHNAYVTTLLPGKTFYCSSYPIMQGEKLDSVIYILSDVTEQHHALEQLKLSEDRYRVLFDEALHGSGVADIETGRIIACNHALAKMVGRTVDELVGQPQAILHNMSPTHEKSESFVQHAAEMDGQLIEDQLVDKEGNLIDVEIHARRMELGGRQVIQGFFYDISERKRLMEEYRRSAQLAALGTIAAGVAHEINNPIQGIMNYAAILEKGSEPQERVVDISQRIQRESERIAELTRELLDFSRNNHKEKTLSDLSEVVESALHLIEKKVTQSGITLVTDSPEDLPKILIYPQGIQQVVINLVDNASDALLSRPKAVTEKLIEVSCSVVEQGPAKSLCLEVADRGVGMSEEVLSKARETFFSTKPSSKGTGLGLSIVNDIVNKHDGTLELESAQGEYTKVKILLPVQAV